MSLFLKLISFIGLGLTIIPSYLVFAQIIIWNTHATMMIIGTLMWFLTAPVWMKKES